MFTCPWLPCPLVAVQGWPRVHMPLVTMSLGYGAGFDRVFDASTANSTVYERASDAHITHGLYACSPRFVSVEHIALVSLGLTPWAIAVQRWHTTHI